MVVVLRRIDLIRLWLLLIVSLCLGFCVLFALLLLLFLLPTIALFRAVISLLPFLLLRLLPLLQFGIPASLLSCVLYFGQLLFISLFVHVDSYVVNDLLWPGVLDFFFPCLGLIYSVTPLIVCFGAVKVTYLHTVQALQKLKLRPVAMEDLFVVQTNKMAISR